MRTKKRVIKIPINPCYMQDESGRESVGVLMCGCLVSVSDGVWSRKELKFDLIP